MFNKIEEAIEDIKEGKIIIVVDDEDRENEGDLVMAAEKATPEAVNFMAKYGRGLICMPIVEERLRDLNINQMVENNTDAKGTAFTVSIDHWDTTTGISAYERSKTILSIIDPKTTASDLRRPGHIFPLASREGGVLKRAGHTEASVDLAKLADMYPAGVICEIMNDDGTMARVPQLVEFAKEHNLKIITIADLIKYRKAKEKLIKKEADVKLPTMYGDFRAVGYVDQLTGEHHVALIKGEPHKDKDGSLIRVHSECLTGDVFGSLRCDCGSQFKYAMEMIEEAGSGVLLYMRQEGRGIGLINKLKAYELQDQGMDTVEANIALGFPADMRDYGIGAQILCDLGINKIKLITNNPAKMVGLSGYGLEIVDRIPVKAGHHTCNKYYIETKAKKMGHMI